MKIRSYKGASLEQLYDAIRRELGPEAVVIASRPTKDRRSLLNPFANAEHELIAVVDDQEADQHLLEQAGQGNVRKITELQTRKWQEMEQTISELRGEIRGLAESGMGCHSVDGLPEFARDWDPRFVKALREMNGNIFSEGVRPVLQEGLKSLLPVAKDFQLKGKRNPHVLVFAGPTGSGKTTTLAKLAAQACLEQKLKVACITTDTFRVAAVDQIKEYATLLGIELAVAFSASEAAAAVQRFSDRDIILVDTPGRSHYDQMGLSGIRGILQGMGPINVMLHVPAGLERRNIMEITKNFQLLNPNYLVLTKADETRDYRVLTTLACAGCPLAFVTDGQRVPQDIRPADAAALARMLAPQDEKAAVGTPAHSAVT